jgi:hypothetical protein
MESESELESESVGSSDEDSEGVAWSQRKSAYSAPAAKKGRKTTAAKKIDTSTTANSFLPLLLSNDRELQQMQLRMPYRLQVPLSPLLLDTGPRRSLLLLLEEKRRHEESSPVGRDRRDRSKTKRRFIHDQKET